MSRHRLLVVSDQALVSEAVRMTVSMHGFDAIVLPWTDRVAPRPPTGEGHAPTLGLMMSDLETIARVGMAQEIVRRTPVPWLVVTSAARGAAWGALLEAGVAAILPSRTSLQETVEALEKLAKGTPLVEEEERAFLVNRWVTERAEREQLFDRIQSLTPRERTVLRLLFSGDKVLAIADLLGVSEATVRSHVRSTLRKLDVNSQLAAVAAYGWLKDEQPGRV